MAYNDPTISFFRGFTDRYAGLLAQQRAMDFEREKMTRQDQRFKQQLDIQQMGLEQTRLFREQQQRNADRTYNRLLANDEVRQLEREQDLDIEKQKQNIAFWQREEDLAREDTANIQKNIKDLREQEKWIFEQDQKLADKLTEMGSTPPPVAKTPAQAAFIADKYGGKPEDHFDRAANSTLIDTEQGYVLYDEQTGEHTPTGLTGKMTKDKYVMQQVKEVDAKIADGTATESDLAHKRNLLYSSIKMDIGEPAPTAIYDSVDQSAKAVEVSNDLLAHFINPDGTPNKNGAGWDSAGPINAIWTWLQDKFGVIPPDKQEFRQDSTRLFSVIISLNESKRLSDTDLSFLQEAVPKRRTNPEAYIAGILRARQKATNQLTLNLNRLNNPQNKWNVAPENMQYYNGLLSKYKFGKPEVKLSQSAFSNSQASIQDRLKSQLDKGLITQDEYNDAMNQLGRQ